DPCANSDDFGRHIRVANVVFDLFQRAGGEKTRRRNSKDLFTRGSQSRRDAHKILLCDAHFNELLWQGLAKKTELPRAARIAGAFDYVTVGFCEIHECRCKLIKIRPAYFQTEFASHRFGLGREHRWSRSAHARGAEPSLRCSSS